MTFTLVAMGGTQVVWDMEVSIRSIRRDTQRRGETTKKRREEKRRQA